MSVLCNNFGSFAICYCSCYEHRPTVIVCNICTILLYLFTIYSYMLSLFRFIVDTFQEDLQGVLIKNNFLEKNYVFQQW